MLQSSRHSLRSPWRHLIFSSPNRHFARASGVPHHLHTMSTPPRRVAQVASHLRPGMSMSAMNGSSGSGSRSLSSSTAPAPGSSTIEVAEGEEKKLVLQRANGGLRTILLNRPGSLNALNLEMIHGISQALQDFTSNSSCSVIALRGVGRALCSGGDVLAVVNAAASDKPEERQAALDFFKGEFDLDYRIARLGEQATVHSDAHGTEDAKAAMESGTKSPKVFVSVMDGITMGGGVGLSIHAPFRIATEKTMFAMPETGIGYFPDVGVTRSLARLDGRVGMYLGMTGARLSGEEAYLAGVATHYIPSSQIEAAMERLAHLPHTSAGDASAVNAALDEFSVDPFGPDSTSDALAKSCLVGERRVALDYVFSQPSAESIYTALEELSSADASSTDTGSQLRSLGLSSVNEPVRSWASSTLSTLRSKSPRSLKVTHRAIELARDYTIAQAFRADMRLATAFCDLSVGRDFHTGVHHTLTKDPKTKKRREGVAPWQPANLEAVDDASVQRLFFDDAARAGLAMEVPKLDAPLEPTGRSAVKATQAALRGKGPLRWEPAHNAFALPSEAECAALLNGEHPAASSAVLEPEELVDALRRLRRNKAGLGKKVREWIERGKWRAEAAK